MSRPLDGLRILDFTRIYSGPYATLMLADMGAEVVKVEHPIYGDDSRTFGPFIAGTSGYFETLNRGKKSVAVDYQSILGQEALRRLIPKFDIVIENFRPGKMATYQLDYATLRPLNPRLIFVSISGYGQFGLQTNQGAYDVVIQAVSGLMSLTGLPELPIKTGPSIADAISGLTAAVGLLGALYRRERSGEGAYVDIAMLDSVFAVLENALSVVSVDGASPQRQGNADNVIAPFGCYQVQDGWVVIAAGNERLWQSLVTVVGDRLNQIIFSSNEARLQHQVALNAILSDWCVSLTVVELLDRLHAADIPCGALRSMEELAQDAHLEARGMLLRLRLDDDVTLTVPGSPIHISKADRPTSIRAPYLGEHTEVILHGDAL